MSQTLNFKKLSFLVYGLGATGISVIKYFKKKRFIIFLLGMIMQTKKNLDLKNFKFKKCFKRTDYIVLSPGISLKKTKYKKNLIKI